MVVALLGNLTGRSGRIIGRNALQPCGLGVPLLRSQVLRAQ